LVPLQTQRLTYLPFCCFFLIDEKKKFVYDDLVINFLGHFLIGGGYSIPQSRVNVFLMGKNEWLEFESWPPAHSSVRAALASEG
jgi:hypothetical protein